MDFIVKNGILYWYYKPESDFLACNQNIENYSNCKFK